MSDDKAELVEILSLLSEQVLNSPDGGLDLRTEDALLYYEAKEGEGLALHLCCNKL